MQLGWPYFVDTQDATVLCMNGGSSACSGGLLTVTCGTAPYSGAGLQGRYPLAATGQEQFTVDFTAMFDESATDGSLQLAGVGDGEHGIFVGYAGANFGIRLMSDGKMQFYKVSVASGASAAGTITIGINGMSFPVAIANNSSLVAVLNAIATNPALSTANMTAYVINSNVYIVTALAFSSPAAPSLTDSGTGCGAQISQLVNGQAPNDTWVYPSDWNGSGLCRPDSVSWGMGNTFRITISSLGFGTITVSIFDPVSLSFTDLHNFNRANSNINTSFLCVGLIPSLYACNFTGNTAHSVSSTGFLMSASEPTCIRAPFCYASNNVQVQLPASTIITLLVLQNMLLVRGVRNSKVVNMTNITLNLSSSQPCQVGLYKDSTFNIPLCSTWSDQNSCVLVDDSTRALVQGGVLLRSWLCTGSLNVDVSDLAGCWAEPGSRLVLCASCPIGQACSLTQGLAVNWTQT